MTTKFTPGPWNFQPCDEYANCFEVLCEEDYYVATTHDGVRGDKNADANARLIAAAPDLLEALQQYGIGFTDESAARAEFGDYEVDRELKRRAAISKATGEQP